ncbi:hypothetical protein ACFL43_00365 [Thermodesulfobacteriota bacterium]
MPNIATVLKDEIQRLARKEIKQAITPLIKSNSSLKKTISEHRRRIAALEKENKSLISQQSKIQKQTQTEIPDLETGDIWIYAKGLKSLRKRLGISQAALGKLTGASMQAVTLWEKKTGRIKIRNPEVRSALAELKSMKKTEVQERLGKRAYK